MLPGCYLHVLCCSKALCDFCELWLTIIIILLKMSDHIFSYCYFSVFWILQRKNNNFENQKEENISQCLISSVNSS